MRGSEPMPWRTISMSAPTCSARRDSSFMKLMRVASIALAAYLVNSALRTSITSMRSWLRMNGAYSARISRMARSSSAPTTMRSGRMKSSTAAPSFRNSGFETTAKSTSTPRVRQFARRSAPHLVGRADRHRALVDDDLVVGHVPADAARRGQHVLQVGRAVLVGRRADGDELHRAVRDRSARRRS